MKNPLARFAVKRTEPFEAFHSGEVHLGGVLDGDHALVVGTAPDGLGCVGGNEFFGREISVVEQAEGGHRLGPSAAGRRDAPGRCLGQACGQPRQTPTAPQVLEVGTGEFVCEIVGHAGVLLPPIQAPVFNSTSAYS